MAIITGGKVLEGSLEGYTNAGAPVDGTDEIQNIVITGSPTGGTFQLEFDGYFTDDIAYDAAAAAVATALNALDSIGTSGVGVTGSGTAGDPFVVTFGGNVGKMDVSLITLYDNSLSGGTTPSVTITEATAGVDATARGAAKGASLVDTTNGILYINTGTGLDPTWTKVGTQT